MLVDLLLLATQQTHKDLDALPHDPRANASESLNARFVWIPDLGEEDIVGMVAEHTATAGIKSIAIPDYWILREGTKWSPKHEKAREDENVMLYLHGGGFAVHFFSPL